ncbi:hypothetical protein CPAV1605_1193 [seawater metagenome]|uniref:EamA domain-containing protein n=1 Tax=seawater metagenome TaxID=1561972 RepID=A0A5E8CM69_9ZZZZ
MYSLILAGILYGLLGSFGKIGILYGSPSVFVLIRNLWATIFSIGLIFSQRSQIKDSILNFKLLNFYSILIGLFSVTSWYIMFNLFKNGLSVRIGLPILYVVAIITADIFSMIFLRQLLTLRKLIGSLLGMIAIYLILG